MKFKFKISDEYLFVLFVAVLIGITIGSIIVKTVYKIENPKPIEVVHSKISSKDTIPFKKKYLHILPKGSGIEHFIAWQFTDPNLEYKLSADTNIIFIKEDYEYSGKQSKYVEVKKITIIPKKKLALYPSLYILSEFNIIEVEYIPLGKTNQVVNVTYELSYRKYKQSVDFFDFKKLDNYILEQLAWKLSYPGFWKYYKNPML